MRIPLHLQAASILYLISATLAPIYALDKSPDAKLYDIEARAQWGEITPDDLKWTTFPPDSNAHAVILSDYASVSFNVDYNINKERHVRIKILDETGYNEGDIQILYHARDNLQRIHDIRAVTYTLDESGEVREHRVGRRDITDDDVSDRMNIIRFSMPALEPGAIIEYRYRRYSQNPTFLSSWNFQSDEPTLWSEFEALIPPNLGYVIYNQTTLPFELQESRSYGRSGSRSPQAGTLHSWAMKNIPALRNEPYMTTRNDYLNRIQFQLREYTLPGIGYQRVLHDWDSMISELRHHSDFGRQIRTNSSMRSTVNDLIAGTDDPQEQMRRIHNYIRDHITWNGEYGILTVDGVRRAFNNQRGNNAEINLMLVAMLQEAGLEADPVIIRLRSSGRIIDIYPMISQFNHVLAIVQIGDESHLLDATRRNMEWNLLPFNALADIGLIISRNPGWIDFYAPAASFRQGFTHLRLKEDGTVSGMIQSRHNGYAGYFSRQDLSDKNEEDYLKEQLLSHIEDAEYSDFHLGPMDQPDEPFELEVTVEHGRIGYTVDNQIFINPMILYRMDDNPFTLPDREFPVDFGIPRSWTFTLNMVIPDGFEVVSIPGNISINFEGHAAYTYYTDAHANIVQVSSSFNFPATRVEPIFYEQLQAFYDQVTRSHNEFIVLEKTDEE